MVSSERPTVSGSRSTVGAEFSLAALILAAGRSERMGRPKLLLPWGQTSILGHLLAQWRQAGAARVVVVHAAQDRVVMAELDRLLVPPEDRVVNPAPHLGMFSSIICAAQVHHWQPASTHCAIVLGDQPHLRQQTLHGLADFAKTHPDAVCQPTHHAKRRHPVVLPRSALVDLARSDVHGTLKEFLTARPIACFECADPGLELDIDYPEDYRRALELAGLPVR